MVIDVEMHYFLAISRKIRPYLEDHIYSFKKFDNIWKTQCSVKIKFRSFRDKDSNFVWKTHSGKNSGKKGSLDFNTI